MKTNFKISEGLTLRKIESLSVPNGIFSFSVANAQAVNLELALACGEIVFMNIKLAPNISSLNKKIHCVKVGKDTVFLTAKNNIIEQRSSPLGKLEIESVTHKFTLVQEDSSKILIESTDKFFAIDVTGKKVPKLSQFQNQILINFENELQIISFDGDYKLAYVSEFSQMSENNGILTLTVMTQTQEGYMLVKAIEVNGKNIEEKIVSFAVTRKNNFNDNLFPIVFFERLKYFSDNEILTMMTNGFVLSDIPKLKKFVGDFVDVTLIEKTCVLNYGDKFRSFTLKMKNNSVDNILEI